MGPISLRYGPVRIPFRTRFSHASATRIESENVVVLAEDADGRIGLGEGCPRSYVTGESVDSALAFLDAHREHVLQNVTGLSSLRRHISSSETHIGRNPAAFCALELALLDLFAQQEKISIECLLNISDESTPTAVTAVYGAPKTPIFLLQFFRFRLNGMTEAKLKITGHRLRDLSRARLLSKGGSLRLDANNLWPDADLAVEALKPLSTYAWGIEEPVRARDWEGLARVGSTTGLAIILDESFTNTDDLDALAGDNRYAANLRVSKLGGLLRSLDAVKLCRERGLDMVVGAQVGETSILARAGLALAHAVGSDLVGFEAGYGVHLLTRDVASPSLTFGPGGQLLNESTDSGFGLKPTHSLLQALPWSCGCRTLS